MNVSPSHQRCGCHTLQLLGKTNLQTGLATHPTKPTIPVDSHPLNHISLWEGPPTHRRNRSENAPPLQSRSGFTTMSSLSRDMDHLDQLPLKREERKRKKTSNLLIFQMLENGSKSSTLLSPFSSKSHDIP